MSDLLEAQESALTGLIEPDDLGAMVEKVAGYAPAVAEVMGVLLAICNEVTSERLDALAEQSLDLRRTNVAIFFGLLHDAYEHLGAIMTSFDLDEWLGELGAYDAVGVARSDLALALAAVTEAVRPGRE